MSFLVGVPWMLKYIELLWRWEVNRVFPEIFYHLTFHPRCMHNNRYPQSKGKLGKKNPRKNDPVTTKSQELVMTGLWSLLLLLKIYSLEVYGSCLCPLQHIIQHICVKPICLPRLRRQFHFLQSIKFLKIPDSHLMAEFYCSMFTVQIILSPQQRQLKFFSEDFVHIGFYAYRRCQSVPSSQCHQSVWVSSSFFLFTNFSTMRGFVREHCDLCSALL